MKKQLLLFAALLAAFALPQAARAYDFSKYNNTGQLLFYTVTGTNTVKVTYPGTSSSPYGNAVKPTNSMTIPSTVTDNGITYTVTAIDSYAFSGCSGLTYVYIPNTVTTIGQQAFYRCTGITSIRLSENLSTIPNYAFYQCESLMGSFSIPNGVTRIGYCAFGLCEDLTSVTIPQSVTYIDMWAFYDCTSLATVNFCAVNCNYMGGLYNNTVHTVFEGCNNLHTIYINSGVQRIPAYAFYGLSTWNNSQWSIPSTVTSIGDYAFYNCTGLSGYLGLPSQLTTIGAHAFEGCTGLTDNLYIPNSVTTIGAGAFKNCTGFNGTLHLPTNLTVIPEEAFYDLHQVTRTLTLPNNLTSIGASAFYNCRSFSGTLTIPASVTAIGDYAFGLCASFTGLAFAPRTANQPLSIDAWAFGHCIRLNGSLTLPEGLTHIGDYAFYNCSGLNGTLTIPSTVTTIDGVAFGSCTNLKHIVYNAADCSTMGDDDYPVFEDCSGVTKVTVGEEVGRINSTAFTGLSALDTVMFNATNCSSMGTAFNPVFAQHNISTLYIGSQVTSIPSYAFKDCTSLEGTLSIPYNVQSIGTGAFSHCENLDFVYMPYDVETIGDWAFEDCHDLSSVTLPATIESIGFAAFFNCDGLTSVTVNNPVPPSLGSGVFSGTPSDMTVTIPCGSLAAYQQAWGSSYNYVSGSGYNTEIVTACDSYTWPINGQTYYETHDEESPISATTYNAEENCTRTDRLILFIEHGGHSHEYVESCLPYTWAVDGRTYNKSGVKTHKGYAANGCPIRDTLTLTITKGHSHVVEATSCLPYYWDVTGKTYNKSGVKTYKSSQPDADGCYTYDTLRLNIIKGYSNTIEVTQCLPYTWRVTGKTYNKSGIKTYKTPAGEDGCAFYDTLKLNIIKGYSNTVEVTSCVPYTWEVTGKTYNKSGIKTYKTPAGEDGCAFYDTLRLNIIKGYTHYEHVENCGPYYWEVTGRTYNKSGLKTYKSSQPDADGCYIYDTLDLVVLNCDPTGAKSNLSTFNSQLSLYPNPTTGLVHIDVKAGSENNFNSQPKVGDRQWSQLSTFNLTVEVLDLVGRCVTVFKETDTLDLSGLAAGTYTLRITMPDAVVIKKVVKK